MPDISTLIDIADSDNLSSGDVIEVVEINTFMGLGDARQNNLNDVVENLEDNYSAVTASPPGDIMNGKLWYDETLDKLYVRSSDAWAEIQQAITRPSFHVDKNGSDQSANAGASTTLTWSEAGSEDWDTEGDFGSNKWTVGTTGYYIVSVQCTFSFAAAPPSSPEEIRLGVYKEGAPTLLYQARLPLDFDTTGGTLVGSIALSAQVFGTAAEEYTARIFLDTTNAATIDGTNDLTWFTATRLI